MGLAEWFSEFCSKLEIQSGDKINMRLKSLTHQLNADFWHVNSDIANSFYVGAFGRGTAIRGMTDVDILFQLPFEAYEKYQRSVGSVQKKLFADVKASIEKTYRATGINADGQITLVPFVDGFTFNVTPGFVNTDGSYTCPDMNSTTGWKGANPKKESRAIHKRDDAYNGNLIPLCRMMRAWRKTNNVPISGLLIDTMAYDFSQKFPYGDKFMLYYDFMCRDFFKFLSEQNPQQGYWLAPGSGQPAVTKGRFQESARIAHNITLDAIAHETASPKQEWAAKNKWRKIFGEAFPG